MIPQLLYDREGQPVTDWETWARLKADFDYVYVAQTMLRDHEQHAYRVSTVWIGDDMNFGVPGLPPAIFETALFDVHTLVEVLERYPTEQMARMGHEESVEYVRHSMMSDPVVVATEVRWSEPWPLLDGEARCDGCGDPSGLCGSSCNHHATE